MPVVLIVAFSAVIPLMTVVNYSVQDILDFNSRFYVGLDWYRETLNDPRFLEAFLRQLGFSFTVLLIEVPLGIAVARGIPKTGRFTSPILILLASHYLYLGMWWPPSGKCSRARILVCWALR